MLRYRLTYIVTCSISVGTPQIENHFAIQCSAAASLRTSPSTFARSTLSSFLRRTHFALSLSVSVSVCTFRPRRWLPVALSANPESPEMVRARSRLFPFPLPFEPARRKAAAVSSSGYRVSCGAHKMLLRSTGEENARTWLAGPGAVSRLRLGFDCCCCCTTSKSSRKTSAWNSGELSTSSVREGEGKCIGGSCCNSARAGSSGVGCSHPSSDWRSVDAAPWCSPLAIGAAPFSRPVGSPIRGGAGTEADGWLFLSPRMSAVPFPRSGD
ncbi:hypothetical protein B0H14DRAFT_224799 [Mycena olivaceomarginata]|nr:hypothetical protein B0H14DRAFT_224799 [Mycena olivaceomarginata]